MELILLRVRQLSIKLDEISILYFMGLQLLMKLCIKNSLEQNSSRENSEANSWIYDSLDSKLKIDCTAIQWQIRDTKARVGRLCSAGTQLIWQMQRLFGKLFNSLQVICIETIP